jgi:hypothetical protein
LLICNLQNFYFVDKRAGEILGMATSALVVNKKGGFAEVGNSHQRERQHGHGGAGAVFSILSLIVPAFDMQSFVLRLK